MSTETAARSNDDAARTALLETIDAANRVVRGATNALRALDLNNRVVALSATENAIAAAKTAHTEALAARRAF